MSPTNPTNVQPATAAKEEVAKETEMTINYSNMPSAKVKVAPCLINDDNLTNLEFHVNPFFIEFTLVLW